MDSRIFSSGGGRGSGSGVREITKGAGLTSVNALSSDSKILKITQRDNRKRGRREKGERKKRERRFSRGLIF